MRSRAAPVSGRPGPHRCMDPKFRVAQILSGSGFPVARILLRSALSFSCTLSALHQQKKQIRAPYPQPIEWVVISISGPEYLASEIICTTADSAVSISGGRAGCRCAPSWSLPSVLTCPPGHYALTAVAGTDRWPRRQPSKDAAHSPVACGRHDHGRLKAGAGAGNSKIKK